jgi:hypothetical protein
MWQTECEGAVGDPDEGCQCLSGTTEMCNAGRGVCAMGERQCEKGMWTTCKSLTQASAEVCDNLDNDCNGTVDGPSATCTNPSEKCVAPGRCAECTIDGDCGRKTTGCDVGKCKSGMCQVDQLQQYAACTNGATRGYCVANQCTAPRRYIIEDGDIGSGEGQVQYFVGAWSIAGDVHYTNSSGAYFLGHFVGTKVAVYGGKNADRGTVEYSICDDNGAGCGQASTINNYAATLLSNQLLWNSPTVTFGAHTVRGRVTGMRAPATDQIIDLDHIDVN